MNRRSTVQAVSLLLIGPFVTGCDRSSHPSATAAEEPVLQALVPAERDAILSQADLVWEKQPTGVQVAVLYGNPEQPGPFGLRLKYPAGYSKPPHYHPGDAFVTVLSGSYYRGYGNRFDRGDAYHLTQGTFSVNPERVSHYEWVEEPAELQVHAVGPWSTVYVDQQGGAKGIAAAPARPPSAGTPIVKKPESLVWETREAAIKSHCCTEIRNARGPSRCESARSRAAWNRHTFILRTRS